MRFFFHNKTGLRFQPSSTACFLLLPWHNSTICAVKGVSDQVGYVELFLGATSVLLKGKQKQVGGEGDAKHTSDWLSAGENVVEKRCQWHD